MGDTNIRRLTFTEMSHIAELIGRLLLLAGWLSLHSLVTIVTAMDTTGIVPDLHVSRLFLLLCQRTSTRTFISCISTPPKGTWHIIQ